MRVIKLSDHTEAKLTKEAEGYWSVRVQGPDWKELTRIGDIIGAKGVYWAIFGVAHIGPHKTLKTAVATLSEEYRYRQLEKRRA